MTVAHRAPGIATPSAGPLLRAVPGMLGRLGVPMAIVGWLTVVLLLDGAGMPDRQAPLGVLTTLMLVVLLARQQPEGRLRTLVVVGFATMVELVSSPVLGIYRYRLDAVPWYVPPAHGLVYLAAVALGESMVLRAVGRWAAILVCIATLAWSAWGLLQPGRPDMLGAFWFGCLAVCLTQPRRRGLFLGVFVVVTWVELVGTSLGVWVWQPTDPTGIIGIGNPPSGVAGGYCWFELVAIVVSSGRAWSWRGAVVGRTVTGGPTRLRRGT